MTVSIVFVPFVLLQGNPRDCNSFWSETIPLLLLFISRQKINLGKKMKRSWSLINSNLEWKILSDSKFFVFVVIPVFDWVCFFVRFTRLLIPVSRIRHPFSPSSFIHSEFSAALSCSPLDSRVFSICSPCVSVCLVLHELSGCVCCLLLLILLLFLSLHPLLCCTSSSKRLIRDDSLQVCHLLFFCEFFL